MLHLIATLALENEPLTNTSDTRLMLGKVELVWDAAFDLLIYPKEEHNMISLPAIFYLSNIQDDTKYLSDSLARFRSPGTNGIQHGPSNEFGMLHISDRIPGGC